MHVQTNLVWDMAKSETLPAAMGILWSIVIFALSFLLL